MLVHEARGPSYMVLSLASQRGVAGNETANDTTPSSTRNALRTIKAQHEFVGLAKKFDDARYPRVRDHLGPCLLEDLAPVGFHVAFARGL